jgi:hypothetical protein
MEHTLSRSAAEVQIPWPGPVPYDESDYRRFVGRLEKKRELVGRAQAARITILLGDSGSGKTSLIRAGVVPELRKGRYTGQGEAPGAWATLLLREGGAKREDTVEENWLEQLDTAISAMAAWETQSGEEGAREEAEFIRSTVDGYGVSSTNSRFVALVEEIATRLAEQANTVAVDAAANVNKGGGLILVFDQFEEQLRSGPIAQRDAFRLIHDIVVGGRPVRILISMRKEFRAELRELESLIGELGRNSVQLERLESPRVVKVIEEVSRRGGISVERRVAERIVGWLTPSYIKSGGGLSDSAMPNKVLDEDIAHTARPDLLKMQAVLVELCRWALAVKERAIDDDLFQRFISDLGVGGMNGPPLGNGIAERIVDERIADRELGEIVLGSALERWIEAAIARDGVEPEGTTDGEPPKEEKFSYAKQSSLRSEELRLQVRRIAVRMAPLLSSADYKIQQEETALFRLALGDEIAKLPLEDPMRVAALEIGEDPEGKLYIKELGGLREPVGPDKWRFLSGPARDWTAKDTGDRLLACFKETLERLSSGNILRRTPVGNAGERKNYWELVHDQFGPNLVRWAANQKGTWDDCESSLVVCRGVQPIGVVKVEIAPGEGESFYDLEGISWQGCSVMQARLSPLTFRRVRFRNCYLVGTIFDSIRFIDCRFEGCEMMGSLFRDCSFEATRFNRCDANIAIVGGTIEDLEFHDCHLAQPAVVGAFLNGGLRYTGGSRVIQGRFDIARRDDSAKYTIHFDSDSSAAYCLLDHQSYGLIKFDNLDLNAGVSPLKDQFRVRP